MKKPVLLSLLLVACNGRNDLSGVDDNITAISNHYLESELNMSVAGYRTVVHDDEDTWIVSYHLTVDAMGSQPKIIIHKESRQIVGAAVDQ